MFEDSYQLNRIRLTKVRAERRPQGNEEFQGPKRESMARLNISVTPGTSTNPESHPYLIAVEFDSRSMSAEIVYEVFLTGPDSSTIDSDGDFIGENVTPLVLPYIRQRLQDLSMSLDLPIVTLPLITAKQLAKGDDEDQD